MITLSEFKSNIRARAISLGFSDTSPNTDVHFSYDVRDVNEDGAKTVHRRTVYYGNSPPPYPSWETIWLRQDTGKIYRYDFMKNLIEETHISDLHESNY